MNSKYRLKRGKKVELTREVLKKVGTTLDRDKNGNGKRNIKSDKETSAKKYRQSTRSSSGSKIPEEKLTSNMINKIAEQALAK